MSPVNSGAIPGEPLTPAAHDRPDIEHPAPAPARKRRAYDVWERDTLPNLDDGRERWSLIGLHIDATSRSAAIREWTGGRPGTFATVLVGEFVEEVVEDPQGEVVEAVMSAIAGRHPDDETDAIRAAVREAIAEAGAPDA
jgi:hypothetical protein